MPGSLFREWKVALGFVTGVAVLAGAFVSDGGEHRYFERFKPRQSDAEVVATPPSPAVKPTPQPAYRAPPGGFSSDAELEAAFSDPEAAAGSEGDSSTASNPAGSLVAEPDAAAIAPGAALPAELAAAQP